MNSHKKTWLLEAEFSEKVFITAVHFAGEKESQVNASLDELQRLIETLGGAVVGRATQKRKRPCAAFFIGRGKALEIAETMREVGASLVVVDHEISGTQQKNLEKEMGCRAMDRTGVILDIFSKHARTKEAKNQVELASLEYLSTHLTRRWTHLERQKGGIGLKGVGERQIELDRRMIRSRISKLKDELAHTENDRATQRKHRDRFLRVAIVGYTNAGKSTLMNNLTTSEVYVNDRLFATLDPTVRVIDPRTRPPVLLSDTVGFIDKLPHSLVASFRSTLAEVLDADLLLHVVDVSSDDYEKHIQVTQEVLEEIGAGNQPVMMVFNKADLHKEKFLPQILARSYVDSQVVSALSTQDMAQLREAIGRYFDRDMVELECVIPYQDTWLQSQVHEFSRVLEKEYLEDGARFRIRIMRPMIGYLKLKERLKNIQEIEA